jgi:hypothetical protein
VARCRRGRTAAVAPRALTRLPLSEHTNLVRIQRAKFIYRTMGKPATVLSIVSSRISGWFWEGLWCIMCQGGPGPRPLLPKSSGLESGPSSDPP